MGRSARRKGKEDMMGGKKKRDGEGKKEMQRDVKSSYLEREFSGRFHGTRKGNT